MFTITAFSQPLLHGYRLIMVASLYFALTLPSLGQAPNNDAINNRSKNTRAALPSEQQQMQAIMDSLDGDEHFWLGENQQQFIALFRPAITPSAMGIIILPDNTQQLLSTSFFQRNHIILADKSWHTLSILLPTAKPPTLPKRSLGTGGQANTSNTKQPATASSNTQPDPKNPAIVEPEPIRSNDNNTLKTSIQRITLANQHLLGKQCKFTSIMAGNAHIHSAISAAISNAKTTKGLILWQINSNKLNIEQLKKLHQAKTKMLDVVDYRKSPQWVAERKRLFARAGFSDNYQLVTTPPHEIGIHHTNRRIQHWLNTQFRP